MGITLESAYRTAIAAVLTTLVGCGYTLQGSGSVLPQDIKSVYIPLADNETTEPGLGQRFTEVLRSRFDRYGVVKVVDRAQDADAILVAKIVNLDSRIRGVKGDTDTALESDLVMTISAELRRKNGQLLYRNGSLQASEEVAGVSDVVVTSSSSFAQGDVGASTLGALGDREVARGQEEQALDDLMEETSRKLYIEAVAADF